jgi:hypothetical protein
LPQQRARGERTIIKVKSAPSTHLPQCTIVTFHSTVKHEATRETSEKDWQLKM